MSIKQNGGVFGRNPTFNDVTIEGQLTFDGDIDVNSDLKVDGNLDVTGNINTGTYLSVTAGSPNIRFMESDTTDENYRVRGQAGQLIFEKITDAASVVAESFRIDASNDIKISSGNLIIGTSGKGIDFSATSGTGTSELFDDYEEGTFTPVVADATSGGNTGATSSASGSYTKIGNMVYLSVTLLNVNTSGMTAGNTFYIRSLPFTSSTGNAGRAEGSIRLDSVTFAGSITPNMDINDSWVRLSDSASGAGDVYLTVAAINSGVTDLFFSIAYQTA